jgi:hypothetical protein
MLVGNHIYFKFSAKREKKKKTQTKQTKQKENTHESSTFSMMTIRLMEGKCNQHNSRKEKRMIEKENK